MQVEQLRSATGALVEGPLLITPNVFGDERGWFFESWNQRRFDEAAGEVVTFAQDNHSRSAQGVLRGLHYQLPPEPQAKLVLAVAPLAATLRGHIAGTLVYATISVLISCTLRLHCPRAPKSTLLSLPK